MPAGPLPPRPRSDRCLLTSRSSANFWTRRWRNETRTHLLTGVCAKRDWPMAEIRVPALGESVTEATIGKWVKQAGDAVAVDEPLVELETDKVTIEGPAPAAGVLGDIAAKDGETVAVGALLGQIREGAAAPAKA